MSVPEITRIPVAAVRRDGGTQIRTQISLQIAEDYAEAMVDGAKFPPIELRYDGTDHWTSDGFHRLMAAELAGHTEIDAIIRPGTRRDALLDAVGANASHGYRRTNADKRAAVLVLVTDAEWSTKSDRQIARLCHVGPDMVGRLRPPPLSVAERQTPAKREVTRGGKTFAMDVAAINFDRPPAAAAPPSVKGSVQLQVLLGELRAGADLESASVVSEIPLAEARAHALAEAREEYADIVAIEPNWKVEDGTLTIFAGIKDGEAAVDIAPAANDDMPSLPVTFDFAAAQIRDAVVQAIAALAKAPPAEDLAAIWAAYTGGGVPSVTVVRARQWLDDFADLFPAAEEARQAAITTKLENM